MTVELEKLNRKLLKAKNNNEKIVIKYEQIFKLFNFKNDFEKHVEQFGYSLMQHNDEQKTITIYF